MLTSALLALAIALEVVGTLTLQRSDGFTKVVPSVVVIVCYIGAIALLAIVLKRGMPVAVTYAIWSAVGIVAVAGLGALFLDQPLRAVQVGAIALIVVGVVLLELTTAA